MVSCNGTFFWLGIFHTYLSPRRGRSDQREHSAPGAPCSPTPPGPRQTPPAACPLPPPPTPRCRRRPPPAPSRPRAVPHMPSTAGSRRRHPPGASPGPVPVPVPPVGACPSGEGDGGRRCRPRAGKWERGGAVPQVQAQAAAQGVLLLLLGVRLEAVSAQSVTLTTLARRAVSNYKDVARVATVVFLRAR